MGVVKMLRIVAIAVVSITEVLLYAWMMPYILAMRP